MADIVRKRKTSPERVGMRSAQDIADEPTRLAMNEVQENLRHIQSLVDGVKIPDIPNAFDPSALEQRIGAFGNGLDDLRFLHERLKSYVYALDFQGRWGFVTDVFDDTLECNLYNPLTGEEFSQVTVARAPELMRTGIHGATLTSSAGIQITYDYDGALGFIKVPGQEREAIYVSGSALWGVKERLQPMYSLGSIIAVKQDTRVIDGVSFVDANVSGRTWAWDHVYRVFFKGQLDLISSAGLAMVGELGYAIVPKQYYFWDGTIWAEMGGGVDLCDDVPTPNGPTGQPGVDSKAARCDHRHAQLWLADDDE